jgi:Fis family transcriptional regulator
VENKHSKGNKPRIDKTIQESLELYFNRLGEQKPHAVLEMVINASEKPTIEFVLAKTKYNLSLSSKILGVTRATLRKKILKHQIYIQKNLNEK